uniref:Uncharacterized protein n=1 Tax=Arundo donax TaxID=35708 RepID=A0A0A9DAU2_ARUDO
MRRQKNTRKHLRFQTCIALEMPMVSSCLLMQPAHKESQPQAREKADREGFEVSVVKTSFKANTRLWRRTKEMDLLRYILGLHAADLSHEASNAIALGTRVQDIKFVVHAHPILSEVLDSSSRLPRLMWR